MTHVYRLAAILAGTTMIVICTSGAVCAAPVAKEAKLVNAKTGKCLTIAGGTSGANNIVAVQFNCDEDPSRRWLLTETNPDSYQIRNAKTNKCLTIAGGVSADNNVQALQFDCDNDRSRTWRLNRQADGSYQIKNVQTGKCLTIAGGTSADNNVESVQFDCDNDPSRRWAISTVAAASTHLTSNWSGWIHADRVQYRYRWGWNPSDAGMIDAIFQVHNPGKQLWRGSVRSVNCTTNTLGSSKDIDLQPNETRETTFKTQNCGSASNPSFKPGVAESATF